MKKYILLIFVSCFVLQALYAQQNGIGLTGDQTLKGHFNVNPYEVGTGVSYQYYTGKRTGVQMNLDFLKSIDDEYYGYGEDYENNSFGMRFMPEFRFYVNRKTDRSTTSFFLGGGPIVKAFQIQLQRWDYQQDDMSGDTYMKLKNNTYNNISYGLMGRLGMECFFGKAKRIVFETSYGFGLTNNHVRVKGDNDLYYGSHMIDVSVTNTDNGIQPYVDIRVALGYRFGKSYK